MSDVRLEIDPKQDTLRVPVILEIEPQRFGVESGAGEQRYAVMAAVVERGLRAQLKSGNLLTGELLVDLGFHLDSPPARLDRSGTYPEIPTVPAELEALEASVTAVLNKLAALPLPELVDDLQQTVQGVDALVTSQLGPLFVQAQSTLAAADGMVGADAPMRYDLYALLKELTGAARSIRVFADYLERHPDALLRGKSGAQ